MYKSHAGSTGDALPRPQTMKTIQTIVPPGTEVGDILTIIVHGQELEIPVPEGMPLFDSLLCL